MLNSKFNAYVKHDSTQCYTQKKYTQFSLTRWTTYVSTQL